MKRIFQIILLVAGVLLIYNTFSGNPLNISWLMLFSMGGVLMLLGFMYFAKGNRPYVAIAFFSYGLLLFLDDFYSLTDNLYLNYDIDIPNIDSFYFPFIVIIFGLYLFPSIKSNKQRKSIFNNRNDVLKVDNKTSRIDKTQDISSKNFDTNPPIKESSSKGSDFDFIISESLNLAKSNRKISTETEFKRGYKSHLIMSKLVLDVTKIISVNVDYFKIHFNAQFSTLVVLIPKNVILSIKNSSSFSNVVDKRTLLPSEATTNKRIDLDGRIFCSQLIIEEVS